MIDDTSGTPSYMAPEILSDNKYEPFGADIWSLGVLLFTLLTGAPPFKSKERSKLKELIQIGEFKFTTEVSEAAKDLCI
jgi:serine/threonine protein kinase